MSKTYRVVKQGVIITTHTGKKVGCQVNDLVEIKLRSEESKYKKSGSIVDPNNKAEYSEPFAQPKIIVPTTGNKEDDREWQIDPVSVEAVALAADIGITVEDVETKIQKVADRNNLSPILAIRKMRGDLDVEQGSKPEYGGSTDNDATATKKLCVGARVIAMYNDELRKGVVHSIRKNGVMCVTLNDDEKQFREFDDDLVELDTEG